MSIRVYGEEYVGMALSARTLATLVRLANDQAGFVVLKGRIEGHPVEAGLDGDEVTEFLASIKVA